MLRTFNRLVFETQWGADIYAPHTEGRVPTAVVGHGIDPTVFRPASRDEKAELRKAWTKILRFDLTKPKWVLVTHETNSYRKNPWALFPMMTALPQDTVLVFHCNELSQPGAGGMNLPRLAKQFGVENRVFFTGTGQNRVNLPERDLADLIRLADLTVSAIMGEGFGIGSIESMACGVPRVITDYTTSREIVGKAGLLARVGGWVPQPESPFVRAAVEFEDMAAKVQQLRDDPKLYKRCSRNGPARVQAHYTTEKIGQDWVNLMARERS